MKNMTGQSTMRFIDRSGKRCKCLQNWTVLEKPFS